MFTNLVFTIAPMWERDRLAGEGASRHTTIFSPETSFPRKISLDLPTTYLLNARIGVTSVHPYFLSQKPGITRPPSILSNNFHPRR